MSLLARAGGPAFVAGTAFDPAMSGKPILWASGSISYYTDKGDLSPLLPQTAANAFVADAFSRWTSVPTAALSATNAGSLAEDVNGSNVVATQSGISLPADIQPSSTKPIAIVYDFDGAVTDTLLGSGASDPLLCATNSILGGVDRFVADGHIGHALLIINGRCAQSSADLAPLKYRLIRAIGRVLGVGWSQANDNVQTNSPFPTSADFAGFPLMHPVEPFCAGAITSCLPNADRLRMDDRAAIARLYPVTLQNQANFPGKLLFSGSTARIHGSIYFPDVHGNTAQPMQGVNVVARLLDPDTGQPSKSAVVTSVSGFLFRGNAGNAVSGYGDAQRFDSFGGADTSQEGFFDLSGLELPAGHTSASYQITLEAINPLYHDDEAVGSYANGEVAPSGAHTAIVVANLSAGSDVQQDMMMSGAAATRSLDLQLTLRQQLPAGGDWWGTLSGYGRAEFYRFAAQANRTVGFQVVSMDESLHPSITKAQLELGLWVGTDPASTLPQAFANAFSGPSTGASLLVAPIASAGTAQVGIADYRGDGRPDFIYHAHLLYADSVTPARLPSAGGTIQISGIGFRPGMAVTLGNSAATILSISENSIYAQTPTLGDGSKNVVVREAATGLSTTMTAALTYGVSSSDLLLSASAPNATVAVGATAPNPVRFKVVSSDGVTPVPGATVTLSVSPTASLLNVCGNSTCMVIADANGEVSSFVTVKAAGANIVTASLSNGQQKLTTIVGTSSLTLFIVPQVRLLSGISTTIPLPARLLSSGIGVSGQQINYSIVTGTGTLDHPSAITDSTGSASVNLTLANFTAADSINACNGSTCAQFSILPIAANTIALRTISGDGQMIPVGQSLQALMMRVVDSASPPNPLASVPVTITGAVFSASRANCALDSGICQPAMQHPLATFNTVLNSDANGLVSYTPAVQAKWGAVTVNVIATAGSSASQNFTLQVFTPGP